MSWAAKGYPGFPAALGKMSSLSKSRRWADAVHLTTETSQGTEPFYNSIFRANQEIWVKYVKIIQQGFFILKDNQFRGAPLA